MDTQREVSDRNTFLVEAAIHGLAALAPVTIYYWIAKWFGKPEYDTGADRRPELSWWGVEVYVLAFTAAAMLSYCGAFVLSPWLLTIPVVVGALRIVEIIRFQLQQLLADRSTGPLRGYRRSLLLLLFNYLEVMLWFSLAYAALSGWGYLVVNFKPIGAVILRESIGLMVANSSGGFQATDSWTVWVIMALHSLVGLFMTTVVAARVISVLPPPGTLDRTESTPR